MRLNLIITIRKAYDNHDLPELILTDTKQQVGRNDYKLISLIE